MLTSSATSPLQLICSLTVRSSLSNCWILLTGGGQKLRVQTSTSTMSIPLLQRLKFELNCIPQDTLTRPHFSFQTPGSRPAPSLSWQAPASQRSASAFGSECP